MIIDADYLHKKWEDINYYDGGYIQIAADHTLKWYVGYKDIKQKTILIISDAEMDSLPSSKSISVLKGIRTDGRWTLSFILLRPEQESVFETLCADIIMFSLPAVLEKEALMLISKRFKQWNRLLEHQRTHLLDENSRKGLLGELLYLNKLLENGDNALRVVNGWIGPDGADNDFVYADIWYEIKSVGISADSISISSLEQLNNPSVGEIVVMRIDKCAPEDTKGVSLTEIVNLVFSKINNDLNAVPIFEKKLSNYGYIDLPEYAEQKYFFSGSQRYLVNSSFPKITVKSVPFQIVAVQYSISLPAIESWMILED